MHEQGKLLVWASRRAIARRRRGRLTLWRSLLTRLWQVIVFAALAAGLLAGSGSWAQELESIDSDRLGDRGVLIESRGEGFFALPEARGIGDFDGDGFDDVVLAARESSFLSGDPLTIAILYGRAGLTGSWKLDSIERTAIFRVGDPELTGSGSACVARAGDVNGDSKADVLLHFSSYRMTPAQSHGTTFLLLGGAGIVGEGFIEEIGSGLPGVVFFSSDVDRSLLDQDQNAVGDFDGDGSADLALGIFDGQGVGGDATPEEKGVATGKLLLLLDAGALAGEVDVANLDASVRHVEIRGRPGSSLGRGVAPAGDFNGDGLDDLLIGDSRRAFTGTTYLVLGRADPPPTIDLPIASADAAVDGVIAFRHPGGRLMAAGRGQSAGLGDLDGDGRDEILLGLASTEPSIPGEPAPASVAWLFRGRQRFPALVDLAAVPEGLATEILPTAGPPPADGFGISVGAAGDTDGDGVGDLLIGAHLAAVEGRAEAGLVYLVRGGFEARPQLDLSAGFDGVLLRGDRSERALGRVVAPAGDFNGDGLADVIAVGPDRNLFDGRGDAVILYGRGEAPSLRLVELSPGSGPTGGGTKVILRGAGFGAEAEVRFEDQLATDVILVNAAELSCRSPPVDRPGPVEVTVRIGAAEARLADAFTYFTGPPAIDLSRPRGEFFRLEGRASETTGHSVDLADITGDGHAELIVGSGASGGWSVSVVIGGEGLPATLSLEEPSDRVRTITRSGVGVAEMVRAVPLGDINGDGIRDLALAPAGPRGWLLFGAPDLEPRLDIEIAQARGAAVRVTGGGTAGPLRFAPLGDLDSDGISELAVAVPDATVAAREGAGEVVLLAGRELWPSDLDLRDPSVSRARVRGNAMGDRLGNALSPAGDTDGDGVGDLLLGSRSGGERDRTYVLFLNPEAWGGGELEVESLVDSGDAAAFDLVRGSPGSSASSLSVAGAGDVLVDGKDDILLSDEEGGIDREGIVLVVPGQPDLRGRRLRLDPASPPAGVTVVSGGRPRVAAGRGRSAGDFDGDGQGDIAVAAQSPALELPGSLTILLGGGGLPDTLDLHHSPPGTLRIEGLLPLSRVLPAASVGDFDGDGRGDLAFAETTGGGNVYVLFAKTINARFIRADSNQDGAVDISDAVFILGFLFLGKATPSCRDALDSNDSGGLDLTDAIYLLNHLFLGGPAPPAPYPLPGEDPSPDGLDCGGA